MALRLRLLRRQSGLTLSALASRADLTESYLSKIERGLSTPSIDVAIRLASALQVDVATLFDDKDDGDLVTVVRSSERVRVDEGDTVGVSPYEGIATGRIGKRMLPFIVSPGARSCGTSPRTHDGEELVFVHRGRIVLEIADRQIAMATGDAAYFEGSLPHRLVLGGRTPASALIVISLAEDAGSTLPVH